MRRAGPGNSGGRGAPVDVYMVGNRKDDARLQSWASHIDIDSENGL